MLLKMICPVTDVPHKQVNFPFTFSIVSSSPFRFLMMILKTHMFFLCLSLIVFVRKILITDIARICRHDILKAELRA